MNKDMDKQILEELEKECGDTPHSLTWHDEDIKNLKSLFEKLAEEVIGELDHGVEKGDIQGALINTSRNVLRNEQRTRLKELLG